MVWRSELESKVRDLRWDKPSPSEQNRNSTDPEEAPSFLARTSPRGSRSSASTGRLEVNASNSGEIGVLGIDGGNWVGSGGASSSEPEADGDPTLKLTESVAGGTESAVLTL